jgi:hypothetical protein
VDWKFVNDDEIVTAELTNAIGIRTEKLSSTAAAYHPTTQGQVEMQESGRYKNTISKYTMSDSTAKWEEYVVPMWFKSAV